eukprot:scaffold4783_cov373-Prasinococcus_capsulatus_cf.AAC.9
MRSAPWCRLSGRCVGAWDTSDLTAAPHPSVHQEEGLALADVFRVGSACCGWQGRVTLSRAARCRRACTCMRAWKSASKCATPLHALQTLRTAPAAPSFRENSCWSVVSRSARMSNHRRSCAQKVIARAPNLLAHAVCAGCFCRLRLTAQGQAYDGRGCHCRP